jgi:hypothetical protein
MITIVFPLFGILSAFGFGLEDQQGEECIKNDSLVRPFSVSTYFISGVHDPELVMQQIEERGLVIREAWIPNADGPCMRVELQLLVVRLDRADERIVELGFTRDSTAAIKSCTATWKHWRIGGK